MIVEVLAGNVLLLHCVDHTLSIWLGLQYSQPTSKLCNVYCTWCAVCIVQGVQCAMYKVCCVYCTMYALCIEHLPDQQNVGLTKRTLISNLIYSNTIFYC